MHKMALNLCSTVMQISEKSHYNKKAMDLIEVVDYAGSTFEYMGLGRTRLWHMGVLQIEDFSEEYKIKGSLFFIF